MMKKQPLTDLQIEEDLSFEQREWKAERIGWAIMAAIILAAVLGAFGGAGVFLYQRLTFTQAVEMEYPLFGRYLTPLTLTFRAPEQNKHSLRTISFSESYAHAMQAERIIPAPSRIEARNGLLVYTFAGSPREITFSMKAEEAGVVRGQVGVGGQALQSFQQFIYP